MPTAATPIPSFCAAGLTRQYLSPPRLVRTRAGRPAVLLGWFLDQHGRRMWAEIVTHTTFVHPEEIIEEEPCIPL